LVEFYKSMAPGGRVSRQTTITGASTQASRLSDPSNSNNPTPNTGNTYLLLY